MPGGSKPTHDFPNGTPLPIIALWIAWPALFFIWVVFGGGFSRGWLHWVLFIAATAVLFAVYSRVIAHYEKTGQAIPIRRITVVTKFPNGLPKPMFAARASFFVAAGLMIFFAVRSVGNRAAQQEVIACVGALIAIAVINLSLESFYVKRGRAVEHEVTNPHAIGRVKRSDER